MEGFTITTSQKIDVVMNENIKAKEVRLQDSDKNQVGIMSFEEALEYAYDRNQDLILIAPNAQPPVCRAIEYGKYQFEIKKREQDNKKNQPVIKVKEIQLSCTIEQHDINTQKNKTIKFLQDGNRVKVALRYKGREMAHQQIGFEVMDAFIESLSEYGTVDKKPVLDSRVLSCVIVPIKNTNKK